MSSAARTNLCAQSIIINEKDVLGEGAFRVCVGGTYVGGNRNQQEAACKRFKSQFKKLEKEFFANDFRIVSQVLLIAEDWNGFCSEGNMIYVNQGEVRKTQNGTKYLVEPLIRYYKKFNSNSGWIGDVDGDWEVRLMAAFTHYSYHRTGGRLIVCDLQGRYKHNRYMPRKSRFELTDPAICSRRRDYGVTDLAEKGIETFFARHVCNEYCNSSWSRPRSVRAWYPLTKATSMIGSHMTSKLMVSNPTTFHAGFAGIIEEDEEDSSDGYY